MGRKAKVKLARLTRTSGFKSAYAGGRQRRASLAALLRLDIALFDHLPPLDDFTLYVLAELGRRHGRGRGPFALKRRQQFGRLQRRLARSVSFFGERVRQA